MFQPYNIVVNKQALWDIYNRCTHIHKYDTVNTSVFNGANAFIDNTDDIKYIEKNIIKPFGIDLEIVKNQYTAFGNSVGFNFNILTSSGFVRTHCDTNKTKINILLNNSTQSPICWPESGHQYYYEYPALIDVSIPHMVNNCHLIEQARVTLQIFLTKPFDYCKQLINDNKSF